MLAMGNCCSVEDCDRTHEAFGYCRLHYRRFKKHGDPTVVLPPKPYAGHSREQVLALLLDRRNVTPNGCWEYTRALNAYGYGGISLNGKTVRVHRLAYEAWKGPIPDGMFVCHRCDNRPCFNPEHLFLGTAADNNSDMTDKGRANRVGFRPGTQATSAQRSRLAEDDVRAIRASSESATSLAARYGISRSYVHNIIARRKWRDLSD
jgi:hypothetical protein